MRAKPITKPTKQKLCSPMTKVSPISATELSKIAAIFEVDVTTTKKNNDVANKIEKTASINNSERTTKKTAIVTKPRTSSNPNLNEPHSKVKGVKSRIPTSQAVINPKISDNIKNKTNVKLNKLKETRNLDTHPEPKKFNKMQKPIARDILRNATKDTDIFSTSKQYNTVLNNDNQEAVVLNYDDSTNSQITLQDHPTKHGETQIVIEEDLESIEIEQNLRNGEPTEKDPREGNVEKVYNVWLNETGIITPEKEIKVGELKKRNSILVKLAETMQDREAEESTHAGLYQLAFNHVLAKTNVSEDQLMLLHTHQIKNPSQVEELKKKRNRLLNEINKKSNKFEEMIKYENERVQSDIKTENLEEYLDMMLNNVKSDISAINQEVKATTEEWDEVNELIAQGRKRVAHLKTSLSEMKEIKRCDEYKGIVEQNKQLQSELQMYIQKKENLKEKSDVLTSLINEDEKTEKKQNKTALKLRASMRALRMNIEDDIEQRYSGESMQDMIYCTEERLRQVWRSTKSLTQRHPYSREHIDQIERETEAIGSENDAMLKLVGKLNNECEAIASEKRLIA